MYPVFLQHYGYTVKQALDENAKTFFSLCGQMYKQQARENLMAINVTNAGVNGGKPADKLASQLKNQAEGSDRLIREAKTIRGIHHE